MLKTHRPRTFAARLDSRTESTPLARHLLRAYLSALPTLARRTREPLRSARAVCAALAIPAAEVNRRPSDCYGALLANPRPDSEADTGELLEALGVFDVPKNLDARDLAIVELFLIAIDAMGGIRAGHQHGLARWFTTGNLTAAYRSLAAAHPLPRTGDPAHYWTTLVTAGELLSATPTPTPASNPPSPTAAPKPPTPPAPREHRKSTHRLPTHPTAHPRDLEVLRDRCPRVRLPNLPLKHFSTGGPACHAGPPVLLSPQGPARAYGWTPPSA
ncbi:hypothetical protein [Kitasatospora sp. NPDC058190]|uniref:hypothetical protein n=1 Tax=Kitasatospora sp. NPDC058190 TaxID=3346371 RepID=UPI0036D7CC72